MRALFKCIIRFINILKFKIMVAEKRKVLEFMTDGTFIAEYESVYEAAKVNELPVSNVTLVCGRKRKTVGKDKKVFRYKDEILL